jgi:hypothetical protein
MSLLRLVSDEKAGPNAIGILVPPARRTFLIVRPRSLSFDLLLLAEARGSTFRDFDSEQAGRAAEAFFDTLAKPSNGCSSCAEVSAATPPDACGGAFQVRVHVGPFHLLVCDRLPGQPYKPLLFPDVNSADAAAERISALLCPPAGVEQEFYFNTRHFQR